MTALDFNASKSSDALAEAIKAGKIDAANKEIRARWVDSSG